MAKLTLSVDDRIISNAKQYAKVRGVSVSQMVEKYLDAVVEPPLLASGSTPVLSKLRGILKDADKSGYRKHLESKYR